MLRHLQKILTCWGLTMFITAGWSQAEDTLPNLLLMDGHYGIGLPFGDLSDRFAEHFTLGSNLTFVSKGKFLAGFNYDFIFGNQTKEDVLSNLKTIDGGIIGRDMQFASVFLRERGHHYSVEGGYFFGKHLKNSISGWFAMVGIGYLRHKIRIVDDFDSVVQILDPYQKGYDRLTAGWSLEQKIGYLYLGKDKLVNFRITLTITEAFTRDLRGYNYNRTEIKDPRNDIMAGLQVAWIVPIYLTRETRYY